MRGLTFVQNVPAKLQQTIRTLQKYGEIERMVPFALTWRRTTE